MILLCWLYVKVQSTSCYSYEKQLRSSWSLYIVCLWLLWLMSVSVHRWQGHAYEIDSCAWKHRTATPCVISAIHHLLLIVFWPSWTHHGQTEGCSAVEPVSWSVDPPHLVHVCSDVSDPSQRFRSAARRCSTEAPDWISIWTQCTLEHEVICSSLHKLPHDSLRHWVDVSTQPWQASSIRAITHSASLAASSPGISPGTNGKTQFHFEFGSNNNNSWVRRDRRAGRCWHALYCSVRRLGPHLRALLAS